MEDIENIVVVPSPLQSENLRNENIPPPVNITADHVRNAATMVGIKRSAATYYNNVKKVRIETDAASYDDVINAEAYKTRSQIAEVLPHRNEGAGEEIQAENQIIRQLQRMEYRMEQRMDRFEQRMDRFEQRMDRFEQRMDRMEARLQNSLVIDSTDSIVLIKQGNEEPPAPVPTTVQEVLELTARSLSAWERYYGINNERNVDIATRRKRLLRLGFGVRLLALTAAT